jgi:hypothetical protein
MKNGTTTALLLAAAVLTVLPREHQPHPFEQLPGAYIAAPTVAANATPQTDTTNGNCLGAKPGG